MAWTEVCPRMRCLGTEVLELSIQILGQLKFELKWQTLKSKNKNRMHHTTSSGTMPKVPPAAGQL
jgi:hypothetical protein